MRKPDELIFLKLLLDRCRRSGSGRHPAEKPRQIINDPDFPLPAKRAWYLLGKYTGRGWYDFGTTLDSGWLTDEGVTEIRNVIEDEKRIA